MQLATNHKVFVPKNLNDALNILKRRPQSIISAGGTLLSLRDSDYFSGKDLLSLYYLDDLRRVFWSDRSVDIGSMVTIEKLMDLDSKIIPSGFRSAAAAITGPQIRSIATLGGNILASPEYLSLMGWLSLAEARIELRRYNGTRWISASRFFSELGVTELRPGEIITRVRIPLGKWNVQTTRKLDLDTSTTAGEFMFYGLAGIHGGNLEDMKLGYYFVPNILYQSRTVEAQFIGKKIPLSDKDIDTFCSNLMENLEIPPQIQSDFMTDRLENLAASFLHSLGRPRSGQAI